MNESYFRYIGKAQHPADERVPFHLLPYHLLDVAAVGSQVLAAKPELASDLAELLEVSCKELAALLQFGHLMHDLGKMTASFQSIFASQGYTLVSLPEGVSYNARQARHDQLGYDVWQLLALPDSFCQGNALRTKRHLKFFLGIFWGHHGKPVRSERSVHDSIRITHEDLSAASQWVADCLELVGDAFPLHKFADKDFQTQLKRASWLLAGFSTYCDWVGSDSTIFTYRNDFVSIADYWQTSALPKAIEAIDKTEVFDPTIVRPFDGFDSLFSFTPSPLQAYAAEVPVSDSPQLFILEDLTGAGKTEAALVLIHRLLSAGAGKGFYFGLPTMATSNAMFGRVSRHYAKMLKGTGGRAPSIVLAHGSRDLNEQFRQAKLGQSEMDLPYQAEDQTASMHCSAWLSDSRKKALLAPVGVGTIDQVLLSVLPKRHQSLRVLGLYGKILVLDEVHAADTYMFELLDSVLTLHASQGGSAILLTATLPLNRRQRLAEIWQRALGVAPEALQRTRVDDFPLATMVNVEAGLKETKVAVRDGSARRIPVQCVCSEEECLEHVLEAAKNGQCVVWVRNSVDEAVAAYQKVRQRLDTPEHCQLFHSRFVLKHRQDKEAWVMEYFGPNASPAQRSGKVLIATQVFQESLDADADLMISDLCLIDDLVQRAGRLHRHRREVRGSGSQDPLLIVHAPEWQDEPENDWLKRHSPNTQYVYQTPGRIWLTLAYLRQKGALELPEQAREMIEYVYAPDAVIPAALQAAEREYDGLQRASSNQGRVNRLALDSGYTASSSHIWTDDKADVGTRLGEEVFEVLLVQKKGERYAPLLENRSYSLELSTLRISNRKLVASLVEIHEQAKADFILRYPRARYSVLVDIETEGMEYSAEIGWGVPAGVRGT